MISGNMGGNTGGGILEMLLGMYGPNSEGQTPMLSGESSEGGILGRLKQYHPIIQQMGQGLINADNLGQVPDMYPGLNLGQQGLPRPMSIGGAPYPYAAQRRF